MRSATARNAFMTLCMHAKMHQRLDSLNTRLGGMITRIETAEIRAYADDSKFQELEQLKKQLLAIRFV